MMETLAELKSLNSATGSGGIDFAATDRKTRKLIVTKDAKKSVGGRLLFNHLNLVSRLE